LAILEENINIRGMLQDLGIGNEFLNRIPIAQDRRARTDK
jgi:hypothetical protein